MPPAVVTNRHVAERHLSATSDNGRYETAKVLLSVIHPMARQEAIMARLRYDTAKRTQPRWLRWYDSPLTLEQEGIVQ
jgi:hypothetical protein